MDFVVIVRNNKRFLAKHVNGSAENSCYEDHLELERFPFHEGSAGPGGD